MHETHGYCGLVDTEALRWFQQVAEGVTVTEVADLYRVSQPGVSRGLSRLEKDVGAQLLRRSGRTLRMTHAGAAFKRHVDALLNQLDDGLAAVAQSVDPETGTVSLAFQRSLGIWLVPALVSSFRATHPQARFELRQARDDPASTVLGTGRVDLELTTLRTTDPTRRWQRLLTEPLCLVVPVGHRFEGRRDLALAEAADEPFVMLRGASLLRRLGVDLCRAAGFEPDVAIEGDDVTTVRGFVAAGLGVAVLPAARVGAVGSGGPVRHVPLGDEGASREVGLAWSRERRLLPVAERFRAHVLEQARARRLPAVAADG